MLKLIVIDGMFCDGASFIGSCAIRAHPTSESAINAIIIVNDFFFMPI
jgi:hypothetical protein